MEITSRGVRIRVDRAWNCEGGGVRACLRKWERRGKEREGKGGEGEETNKEEEEVAEG